ncbi:casein kinase I [Anopheles gambiae]|uniref:non-specific serine/threonine protein kinase n=1 Tax=Anopheles gambiae TaxID=7165 RepID=A0A1S4GN90_ANOGA|nr:casein kinase I [Anopheles gambiae]
MNLICNKYRRIRKIGMGTFCNVYLGEDIENGLKVAIKMDKCREEESRSLLPHEYKVYAQLAGCEGIPVVHLFGQERGYNVIVMDKLGPSLEDLFNFCSRRFSLKTVMMLVDQMITKVAGVHKKNIIHRDLKPDNFVMGAEMQDKVLFLVDFGLAKKYYNPSSRSHIAYREGRSLVGTARYASLSSHLGIELSRRDDMESIGYVMVYFRRGSLPWQGLQGVNKFQRNERIMEKKLATSIEDLCAGLPEEFGSYLQYCRSMSFDEQPDYQYWISTFREVLSANELKYDLIFDWHGLMPSEAAEQDSNNASATTADES